MNINGVEFGIEYDGIGMQQKAHRTEQQILHDIGKTKVMQGQGMHVIRIREQLCYPWPEDGLTKIITLNGEHRSATHWNKAEQARVTAELITYINSVLEKEL
jgi:hypothetical protein